MKSNGKSRSKMPAGASSRTKRLTCMMSEEELRFVNQYLRKYHITNKSRWMRETLLRFIHFNVEADYPTLFDEHQMRR